MPAPRAKGEKRNEHGNGASEEFAELWIKIAEQHASGESGRMAPTMAGQGKAARPTTPSVSMVRNGPLSIDITA